MSLRLVNPGSIKHFNSNYPRKEFKLQLIIYNSKVWIQLDTSFLKEYEILGKIKYTTQLSRDNLKLYLKITKPRLC